MSFECRTTATRTARKAHTCELCLQVICPGEKYWHVTGKDGGEFF